ncbi:MAG: acyl-CoA dehydratase activase [Desulfobacterales bacterium]
MKEDYINNEKIPGDEFPGSLKVLGICLGASTVSIVQVIRSGNTEKPKILNFSLHPHEGDPKKTLIKALEPLEISHFDRIAATGRKFRHFVELSSISEPEAVEYAYQYVKPGKTDCPAVISAGGETFMVYALDHKGRISNVITGNKCASGTGEFLLQQLRRMNVSLDEAAMWAAEEKPYHVSGRCSVFCKSDCTHATNKGIPKKKVTAGLCKMMANKILELLKKVERKNLMLVGGASQNRMMVEYLAQETENLIVPKQAPYFEALGAALWATENETKDFPGLSALISSDMGTFDTLPPLVDFESRVEFKTLQRAEIRSGDICILGLDVGSTTTKATLIRKSDNALLASVYLRTNGDPVGASRNCYRDILLQVTKRLNPDDIVIEGLGVCGSGRQIAGLHALTDGVINEIIAHATAAIYFDSAVDTIFEIGGQDAKYTYITNSVPSDYAMNEACSAGTGSFLEESAYETLGVKMEEIADVAMKGRRPPNFNDQCAAFIASDIKNAIHEGVAHEDIVAGLVYSICMNYSNRVKGNRPVGEKVFMQGGVCYNSAVPLAMAALVDKPIIVPPEPGLMGAYGVALEVKNRIEQRLMEKQYFDLKELADREVQYGKSFVCRGGKENCDRRCEVATIQVEGKKYPFGGACNRYYNLRHNVRYDVQNLDLINLRQKLIFQKYGIDPDRAAEKSYKKRIGINRSFLVNTYYPLYSTFFDELRWQPVVPKEPSQKGIDQRNAAFCYPVELAHGFFYSLIHMEKTPDILFLPHFKATPQLNGNINSQVCPFVQGETYYLQATYQENLEHLKKKGMRIFSPVLDLSGGLEAVRNPMVEMAIAAGENRLTAEKAFFKAVEKQKHCMDEMKASGRKALDALKNNPEKIGVVIFSRPYNGFVEEAHMGIPRKLASRGVMVIPMDFLPIDGVKARRHMYWGMGQLIMMAARVVKANPQLFGTYITNFSCGPDSFLLGYFRELMGRKPSLTLELDSHTADAGLETRIEAFLDIVSAYRQLATQKIFTEKPKSFTPAKVQVSQGKVDVVTSSGNNLSLSHPRVTLLVPSMGKLGTEAFAAVFRQSGVRAVALPPADESILKIGRANTSCKECLPLILTTGSLLNYVRTKKRSDEVLVYFMATGSGPCRFGQYYIFMEDLISRLKIADVAMFSLSSEDSYAGMDKHFVNRSWWAVIVSDVMEDIRSMILANASDTHQAISIFEREWDKILREIEHGDFKSLEKQVAGTSVNLRRIALKRPSEMVPTIAITGEIYVRRDSLSRQYLTEKLAEKGFAVICSPIAEWVHYCDFLLDRGLSDSSLTFKERIGFYIKRLFMKWYEYKLKRAFCASSLVHAKPFDVKSVVRTAKPYISEHLTGEAVLTVGSSLSEVASHACGVIAIGPFGCMPNRMSESILTEIMNRDSKLASNPNDRHLRAVLSEVEQLPFLAIESDGSPFPQLINAKLETFCLRAERLHKRLMKYK